jgi:hypothetical protein
MLGRLLVRKISNIQIWFHHGYKSTRNSMQRSWKSRLSLRRSRSGRMVYYNYSSFFSVLPLRLSYAFFNWLEEDSRNLSYPMAPTSSDMAFPESLIPFSSQKAAILNSAASLVKAFRVSSALAKSRDTVETASANQGSSPPSAAPGQELCPTGDVPGTRQLFGETAPNCPWPPSPALAGT